MKSSDLERLLASSRVTPRRSLRKNFTSNIISELEQRPRRRSPKARLQEFLNMKLVHKPALAAVTIALVAVGGTAYATNGFGFLNALFKSEHQLASGDRVVQVDTKDCEFVDAVTVTQKRTGQASYFYKVKKDSKLTNEQITQMVQAECDWDAYAAKTPDLAEEARKINPANTEQNTFGGYVDSTVVALSDQDITIQYEIPVASQNETHLQTARQTYPIDPQVLVTAGPTRLSLQALSVGNHITFVYRDDAHAGSDFPPTKLDTSQTPIVAIYKNLPATTLAIDFQKHNMKDFERVEPCTSNPTGYCSLSEYYQNKDQSSGQITPTTQPPQGPNN